MLEPLGLRAEIERGGGILDVLRPGATAVCEQEPQAGSRVRRGRVRARRRGEALLSRRSGQASGVTVMSAICVRPRSRTTPNTIRPVIDAAPERRTR